MDSEYHIAMHVKTPDGLEKYAEFFLGNNHQAAIDLFKMLHGSYNIAYESILLMEFRAINRGLPIDIRMKHCTLDEITQNCRIITKYLFNSFNLKDTSDN